MAPRVTLSPEEKARLVRRMGMAGRRDPRSVRARLVLLAADGLRDIDIAGRLDLDRRTVARWRRRFLTRRLRGLDDAPGVPVRGRIPEERIQGIVRATLGRVPPVGTVWSTRRLAREFGVSHMTVRRVWDLYRVRPPSQGPSPPRADPVGPNVPCDVVGLYLRSPVAAVVVTLRPPIERPRIERSRGIPSHGRGSEEAPEPRRATGPGAANRVLSAFRSLRPTDLDVESEAAGIDDFLRYLGDLERRLSGGVWVRVVVLAPRRGLLPTLNRWTVRHPDVELELVADFPEWQRRVLATLRVAGRRESSLREFRGPAEIARSLAQSLRARGDSPGPFVWMATRTEIASGDSAYRLRYDLAVTGGQGLKDPATSPSAMEPSQGGMDATHRAMARQVLRRYLGVRRGERVTIESWTGTLGYANALSLEALRIGARPLTLYQDEPTYWAASTEVAPKYLASLGDHRRAALERTDVFVSFFGPSDRERFHSLPSPTMFKLGEYQDALYRAAERAGARAVQLAIGRVSEASARMYGVDAEVWRKELVEGTLVDPDVMRRRGRRLAERLATGKELELSHPNGSRLVLRLKGYRPVVSDGAVRKVGAKGPWSLETLPAGVIAVAVDERSAEGTFRSNLASSIGLSDTVGEMSGGRWTFRDGRFVSYGYDEGEEFFAQSYRRAPEGRDRPASVSIGLNDRLQRSPLLEDQGLGTVTMHLGRNDRLGGRTHTPWWAWIFQRGGDVRVDGRYLVRKGKLTS